VNKIKIKTTSKLKTAVVFATLSIASGSGYSFEMDIGSYKANIDTSLSAGISVRSADPDPVLAASSKGDANFEKNDIVSSPLKGSNDIKIANDTRGVFVRFTYLYDPTIEDKSDAEIPDQAKGRLGHDLRLLDAFLFSTFMIGEKTLEARLGNQVVSWGESTFIQGGINSINPLDVGRLLMPGSEVKEGLLPAPIAWFSLPDIFPYTGLEFYYQSEWDETELPPVGTFFSPSDLLGEGDGGDLSIPGYEMLGGVPKGADKTGRDDSQFGIRLSTVIPKLDYAELGFYFVRYHNQMPVLNGSPVTAFIPNPSSAVPPFLPVLGTATYFWEYPEKTRLYGMSYNYQLGEAALQGEISYRPNFVVGMPQSNVIGALLSGQPAAPYERMGYYQAQTTATQFFNNVAGSDRITVVAEAGVAWLEGDAVDPGIDGEAWGVTGAVIVDYFDVYKGVTLAPNVSFDWNLKGTLGPFSDNSKEIKVGLEAKFVDTWSTSISYVDYFGDSIYEDRDIVTVDAKYAF